MEKLTSKVPNNILLLQQLNIYIDEFKKNHSPKEVFNEYHSYLNLLKNK